MALPYTVFSSAPDRSAFASVLLFGFLTLPVGTLSSPAHAQAGDRARTADRDVPPTQERSAIVVDDFESYAPGSFPDDWVYVTSDRDVLSPEEVRDPGESVAVLAENGNQFVRVIARDAVVRYTKRNSTDFDWDLGEHPILTWRWRALKLPEDASERGKNDTGAALYVTFGTDWLGRPKSIKYTYSSSLNVGTVVDFGSLKVIVADSAPDSGTGSWQTVTRHVAEDYRNVFGEEPPTRPPGITFWSDSDTTHDVARVDFDAIRLLPRFFEEQGEGEK
jgi:hypothetical protein